MNTVSAEPVQTPSANVPFGIDRLSVLRFLPSIATRLMSLPASTLMAMLELAYSRNSLPESFPHQRVLPERVMFTSPLMHSAGSALYAAPLSLVLSGRP